jgi:hypothetical protein
VEYTGAVGTAPLSKLHADERAIDATPPSSARAFLRIGMATVTGAMAMALTALRLYASYFGNSIYVWGRMISVVNAGVGGRI